ncbi:MAG: glycosyltransferase [Candidatus Pacebacteria bacterium]|nr:glycosyltransferase [Candidatus Paceibacterota bacterium]
MKFTIVTPVFNGAAHIRSTIESVVSQRGDFSIEYIVRDGGSTDGSVSIVQEYKDRLSKGELVAHCKDLSISCVSEKDQGMYDAINKGFSDGTGDILAWINADDYYLPGAFQVIARTFETFSEITWLKGQTCFIDENEPGTDAPAACAPCYVFEQSWIRRGIYGRYAPFIHQDSVFWRRSLWDKIKSIDHSYKLAGDYWLWTRFAEHSPLYSLNQRLSVFRSVASSLSHAHEDHYRTEQARALPPHRDWFEFRIKLFFWLKNKLRAEKISETLYPLLFKREQKDYIDMAPDNIPIKKLARSYIAHP